MPPPYQVPVGDAEPRGPHIAPVAHLATSYLRVVRPVAAKAAGPGRLESGGSQDQSREEKA